MKDVPPIATDYAIEPKIDKDPRVRLETHGYRVVFPDGKQKGPRFFVNNSAAVIERLNRDTCGTEKWDWVTQIPKPKEGSTIDSSKSDTGIREDEDDRAIYWLLAGPGAE